MQEFKTRLDSGSERKDCREKSGCCRIFETLPCIHFKNIIPTFKKKSNIEKVKTLKLAIYHPARSVPCF